MSLTKHKIVKNEDGYYIPLAYNDIPLWLLSSILLDIGCNPEFFISALKENWETLGTNVRYLKRKKNIVIIGDALSKDKRFEFELDINHLIKILEQWGKLCQQEVDEIIMTRDGDTITLEGKNKQ